MCHFIKYVFSHVLSNRLLEQMQSNNSCMWAIFWNVSFHMCPRIVYLNRCKFTLVACVWFSQMWVFKGALKSPSWTDAKSQLLHVSDLLIFLCLLKWPTWPDANSHLLHVCDFLKCEFSHLLSNRHNSCMWAIFLNIYFHMSPQIAYLNRCKFTLVAHVSFSQMWVFTFAVKSPKSQ